MSAALAMAVLPQPVPQPLRLAVQDAGGELVAAERAEGLIWLGSAPDRLRSTLDQLPSVRWVQLPWAGVEEYLPAMRDGRDWTCARGVFADLVAEHAMMLAAVGLRRADLSSRVGYWLPQPAVTLFDADITIVGGGAIATELLALLAPYRARVTVVRRTGAGLPGAHRVVPPSGLDDALRQAQVVFLAAALTPLTRHLIDANRLRLMRPDAVLVNVSRGELVVTADLVEALRGEVIAGAGLDVTSPEPLPREHPLWRLPNCFITSHSAGDVAGAMPAFTRLVGDNVRRRRDGRPLSGLVDAERGY